MRPKELFKPNDSDTKVQAPCVWSKPNVRLLSKHPRARRTLCRPRENGGSVHVVGQVVFLRQIDQGDEWQRVDLDGANTRIQREKGIKDSRYFFTSDILKGGAKNVARRQHRLNLCTGVSQLVFVFCALCFRTLSFSKFVHRSSPRVRSARTSHISTGSFLHGPMPSSPSAGNTLHKRTSRL